MKWYQGIFVTTTLVLSQAVFAVSLADINCSSDKSDLMVKGSVPGQMPRWPTTYRNSPSIAAMKC